MSPGAASAPAVRLEAVDKAFRLSDGCVRQALSEVSLTLEPGEFVTVLGPSGCGKTTLLRIADGLIPADAGRVSVFGQPPEPRPDIGLVFQSFRLIPWATALANVEFALRSLSLPAADRRQRALEYLELVGLAGVAGAYPRELSGGMKQRVALARALACAPRLLLMDEPFASIDAQTRELMQLELLRIWERTRPAVLFVTHSVDEAIVLSDRIVLMGPRPGRIVETLKVDLARPRWSYDARSDPVYADLRRHLSQRMRELVLSDPGSEFYGRQFDQDPSGEGEPPVL